MKRIPQIVLHLAALANALLLASCAESRSPIVLPGTVSQEPVAVHAVEATSWMQSGAKDHDLIYVSNGDPDMLVFTYPSGKLVGTIRGFGDDLFGLCVDKEQDVWIAAETHLDQFTYTEYPHGGTRRMARFRDRTGVGEGCAVDPVSGHLAVVNWSDVNSGQGNVTVYSFASRRPPTVLQDSTMYFYFGAAYDNKGDLFVAGSNYRGDSILAELPYGGTQFINLKLPHAIGRINDVLWDGQFVVAATGYDAYLNRLTISGSKAVLYDTVTLPEEDGTTPWIAGNSVIGGDAEWHVFIWAYPGGGRTKVISNKHISGLGAVALSLRTTP